MTCVLQGAQAPTGFSGLGVGEPTVTAFERQCGPLVYSSDYGGTEGRGKHHKPDRREEYFHHLVAKEKNSGPGASQASDLLMPWPASSSTQSSFPMQSSIVPNLASHAFYSRKMHTHFHGQGQVPCESTRCRVDPGTSTRQQNPVDSGRSTQCPCCVDTPQFVHPSTGSTRGRNTDWVFQVRQVKQQKYGFPPVVRNGGRDMASLTTPLKVDCSVEYEMPCLPSIPPDSAPILQIMSRSDAGTKGSCHKSAPPGTHGSKLPDLTRLEAAVPPSQLTKPPIYNWTQSYQNTMATKTSRHNTIANKTLCQPRTIDPRTSCLDATMGTGTPCLDMMGVSTPCFQDTMGSRIAHQTSSHCAIVGVMDPTYHNGMDIRVPFHQNTYCDSMSVRTPSQSNRSYQPDPMTSGTFSHPALIRTRADTSNPTAIRTRPDISHSGKIGPKPNIYYPIVMGTRPFASYATTRGTHPHISHPHLTRNPIDISQTKPHTSHASTAIGIIPDMLKFPAENAHRVTNESRPDLRPRRDFSNLDVARTRPDVYRPTTISTRPDNSHTDTIVSGHDSVQPAAIGTRRDISHSNHLALTIGCLPIPTSPETDSLHHVMDGAKPASQFQADRQTAGAKRKLTSELCMEQCARPIYLETSRKRKDSDGSQAVQSTQSGSIKRQRLSYPGMGEANHAAAWPQNAYYSLNNNNSNHLSSSGGVNNAILGYAVGHPALLNRGFYRDIRYGFHSF